MAALYAPRYYVAFQCKADRCSHSCCVGWEIDIDEEALALYRSLPGAIGKEIREAIDETDAPHFRLGADERCPLLDGRGLCRIISTVGEGYLCDICREHPRFYNTVGGRLEGGLGASCEEAARLILEEGDYATLLPLGTPDSVCAPCGFDATPLRTRLFACLSDRALPLEWRLAAIEQALGNGADALLYGHTHRPVERILPAGTVLGAHTLTRPFVILCPGSLGDPPDGIPTFGTLTLAPGGILPAIGKY